MAGGIIGGIAAGVAAGISDILIRTSPRAIGQIYADVTVEENHRDEVIITQHPVEQGGIITDHAFKRPSELEIRCGFSDSTAGYDGYVQEQYRALLDLQLARQPFDVYTGKRAYRNMLIRGLSVVTDPHSEFVLMASVALQEVILVSTQTTGNGSSADTATPSSDPSQQADPSATGDIANRGDQAGVGVGAQSFAGAFNPGSTASAGDLGLGGAVGSALDGLSPPTATGDVGAMTVQDGATGEVITQGDVPAPPLNIFGSGNPGF